MCGAFEGTGIYYCEIREQRIRLLLRRQSYLHSHGKWGSGMDERQQILYMQARIIRLASERWNRSISQIAELFAENDVLRYIEEGFGVFHVEGDEAVLEDVITYLKNRGEGSIAEING